MKRRNFLKLLSSLPFVGFLFKDKSQPGIVLPKTSTWAGNDSGATAWNGSVPVDLGIELDNLFRIASQGVNPTIYISRKLMLAIEEKWGVSSRDLSSYDIPVIKVEFLPFCDSKDETQRFS